VSDEISDAMQVLQSNLRDSELGVKKMGIRNNDAVRDALDVIFSHHQAESEPPAELIVQVRTSELTKTRSIEVLEHRDLPEGIHKFYASPQPPPQEQIHPDFWVRPEHVQLLSDPLLFMADVTLQTSSVSGGLALYKQPAPVINAARNAYPDAQETREKSLKKYGFPYLDEQDLPRNTGDEQ
jgi:hypothetical protein